MVSCPKSLQETYLFLTYQIKFSNGIYQAFIQNQAVKYSKTRAYGYTPYSYLGHPGHHLYVRVRKYF